MYSTPFFVHSSTSVGLIGREALEMSVSPPQNFLKPPPVPEIPTVTLLPGFAFWNSSATASVIGNTVLEPSTLISASPDFFPHPSASENAAIPTKRVDFVMVVRSLSAPGAARCRRPALVGRGRRGRVTRR